MANRKVLILHHNCPGKEELKAACQDDVAVVFYVPPMRRQGDKQESTNLVDVCKDAKQVGFVWQNQGQQSIPFDGFESALHDGLTVDLITCSLGKDDFKDQMEALESKYTDMIIRYSLDKTSNPAQGGDWIMESHGTSVKLDYFTDALSAFTHVLDTIAITLEYDSNASTLIIQNDNSANVMLITDTIIVESPYTSTVISCSSVEFRGDINWPYNMFLQIDGDTAAEQDFVISGTPGNKITIINASGNVYDEESYIGLIKNEGVTGVAGIVGWSVEGLNVHCVKIGVNGGGIIQANANVPTVRNCTFEGEVSGNFAGGICGQNAGTGGTCTITGCSVVGIVSGDMVGGICGLDAGYKGECHITGCSVVGEVSGGDAGGICGFGAGYDGSCNITGCSVVGEVSGDAAGGICGSGAGIVGQCDIYRCSVKGEVSGDFARGICSSNESDLDGSCNINSCYLDTTTEDASFATVNSNITITNCWTNIDSGGQDISGNVNTDTGLDYLNDVPDVATVFALHNNDTSGNDTDNYIMLLKYIPHENIVMNVKQLNEITDIFTVADDPSVAVVNDDGVDVGRLQGNIPDNIWTSNVQINLKQNEVFDGKYNTIDISSHTNCRGLFVIDESVNSFTDAPTIKNLGILNGHIDGSGGFIIGLDSTSNTQKFFNIENCYTTGTIKDNKQGRGALCGVIEQPSGEPICSIRNSHSVAPSGTVRGDYKWTWHISNGPATGWIWSS